MTSLTVRINRACHDQLRELAVQSKESMVSILEKAVEQYRRRQFLKKANADFGRLQRNKKAWRDEQRERKAWDATLQDGLESE